MAIVVVAGFIAGFLISILAVLAEHSRVAFNSYALFGNGALIIPGVLAPFALYAWTWVRSRGGRALEMALYVVGLHFGVGMISVLDVLLFSARADVTVVDALPGLLFQGAIFVLPAALFAGLAYWVGTHASGTGLIVAIILAVLIAPFLAIFFGAGLGLLSGGAVAMADRAPSQRVAIGVALLVTVVLVGNLPLIPALLTPLA